MSKQLKNKLLNNLKSKQMSTEYINEFGERIIILGDGPQENRPQRQELNINTGTSCKNNSIHISSEIFIGNHTEYSK